MFLEPFRNGNDILSRCSRQWFLNEDSRPRKAFRDLNFNVSSLDCCPAKCRGDTYEDGIWFFTLVPLKILEYLGRFIAWDYIV